MLFMAFIQGIESAVLPPTKIKSMAMLIRSKSHCLRLGLVKCSCGVKLLALIQSRMQVNLTWEQFRIVFISVIIQWAFFRTIVDSSSTYKNIIFSTSCLLNINKTQFITLLKF